MNDLALQGLGDLSDPQAQQRAAQYFDQMKQSSDGWKIAVNALGSRAYTGNDYVQFFCFQIIEDYIKTRYMVASSEDQGILRSFLLSWIRALGSNGVNHGGVGGGSLSGGERSFILNKAAQLCVIACLCDYPLRWASFFDDLLSSLNLGARCVDLYLRILLALDVEVVDRDIAHTPQELQRNTIIKDTMREHCVERLVDSWYLILVTYETQEPSITCACLNVVGAYVSWIDIGLIANNRFVSLLLRFMTNPLLRESACDCMYEIISKGMEPTGKLKLVESFASVLSNAGLLSIADEIGEEDEGDYLAKLSKLINGMGLQLIQCWQKLDKQKADDETRQACRSALESKLPIMLKFLSSEDDDISGNMASFAHDYVSHLKQLGALDERSKAFTRDLLYVVINKMKYDESYSFDAEGEEEAMFQEYRKELKVLMNNIGALDSQLLVETIHRTVTLTLSSWQSANFTDVEHAITLIYQLGEAVPASHSQHFSGDQNKSTALQDMMKLLLTSDVSRCAHSAVQLQFFETVVRYDKYFIVAPQYIPDLLRAFLDERGLFNSSVQVRSRTSYLFSRFVKSINKSQLQPYLDEVLERMQELLTIHTPQPQVVFHAGGLCNGSAVVKGDTPRLSAEDQQFMYETAGILIVQSQFPPQHKEELMRRLLAPIVNKFDELLTCVVSEADPNRQLAYAICLSQAMGFASRTSKGFSGQVTVRQNGCVTVYTRTLELFLRALDVPVHRMVIQQGVRQFLHRMVVCLDAAVLPYIPAALERLLQQADVKELQDFIPLINQVIQKFKKDLVPFLGQVFMPIVTTIFRALGSEADERDQVTQNDKNQLRRGYFLFISTLVNNNVTEVLTNQSPSSLEDVLMTIIQGAVEIPDPQAQKTCFTVLKKLIETWGDKTEVNGYDSFMYKIIVPACFMAPMKPTFDFTDAQTVLALHEAAECLKTMYSKRGEEFIQFLQNDYLPQQNAALPVIHEFCLALKSDSKQFRNYYKNVFAFNQEVLVGGLLSKGKTF